MMVILVCGGREWDDKEAIRREVLKYGPDVVIHGAARGADPLAGEVAHELGVGVRAFPAEWRKYGKSAGIRRNIRMLEEQPDLVLAFHDDLEKSRGTRDMVMRARDAGIETLVIPG